MENNIRLIKKINGLKLREIDCEHPIDNFHFIEYTSIGFDEYPDWRTLSKEKKKAI